MIRLLGRLRSMRIGPVSVVSAEPRLPSVSKTAMRRWNRGAGDQAETEAPLAAEIDVEGGDAVRVLSRAIPGPAAVARDPKLDDRRAARAGVVHGVSEREPRAGDQKGPAVAGGSRVGRWW